MYNQKSWRHFIPTISILGIIALTYYQVATFSFLNFDDDVYITANPYVTSGLTWGNLSWAFQNSHGGHWHPLTWIAHMVNVELFGLDSGLHHLANVFIHSLNCLLLYFVIFRLTNTTGLAFFSACIFGIHPMRIESVVWLSELKDVLSMLFALSSILAYSLYSKKQTLLAYAISLGLFLCGLLAKPNILTVPILLLLLDFWPLGRFALTKQDLPRIIQCLFEKIPFLVLSICSVVATTISQQQEGSMVTLSALPIEARISTAALGYFGYLGKFFLPIGLGIFYPLQTNPPGIAFGAVLGLCAITWLCFSSIKHSPYLTVGWLWFIISIAPVIGIIQFGGQAYADRWSYLGHIGLLFGLAYWTRERLKYKPKILNAIAGLCILVFASWTWRELPHWEDSISIFSHTLEVSPNNFMAHTNLGSALDRQGDFDGAIPHYEEAARLNPTYPEALNNLGIVRARKGQYLEAIELFNRALSIRPNFPVAKANLNLAMQKLGGR